ncbi:MAG TPA: DUF47 family protein [Thermoanaerobaculia bacterium]|nr:DUF47 family protein [Thermoanaerobaculia bacterium]
MKLDAVIRWFMPKEERFHLLFDRDTANLVAAAKLFGALVSSTQLESRRIKLIELKGLEHEGDLITQKVLEALNSTFITPMDREDISALAADLDDILDYLESTGQLLVLFQLEEAPEALRQFAAILEDLALEVERGISLIWNLGNEKQINESLRRISDHENRADELYQTVLADLFNRPSAGGGPTDPVAILKWKEVYDGLENACDACKDVANTLHDIVVKGV